jgi:hypothetical protein
LDAVSWLPASDPDELLDDELDDRLELDGNEAVGPGEPGIDGIEAEDDDEELGIDGAEDDDDEEDELGIEGGDEDEDDDGEELGIDGIDEELELDWLD